MSTVDTEDEYAIDSNASTTDAEYLASVHEIYETKLCETISELTTAQLRSAELVFRSFSSAHGGNEL